MNYNWAENKMKLARASAKAGQGASEEAIKNIYIEMAGKLLEVEKAEDKEIETEEVSEEKPKRGRKAN